MKFICDPCKAASSVSDKKYSKELHGQCKGGTQCDCQHRRRQR